MSSSAFAADHKVLVAPAMVDCVAEMEASCALRKKGVCFPAADGNEFPEHTYPGTLHEF